MYLAPRGSLLGHRCVVYARSRYPLNNRFLSTTSLSTSFGTSLIGAPHGLQSIYRPQIPVSRSVPIGDIAAIFCCVITQRSLLFLLPNRASSPHSRRRHQQTSSSRQFLWPRITNRSPAYAGYVIDELTLKVWHRLLDALELLPLIRKRH